ncbi:DNA-directed RNA polymerase sigma-70 factor [Parapedobacter defluvii]|uniref:DNA-directed RNA polymerase sigma-70 factor n=1 Tax=Parapedobacter defluvii TaxID=2045106 RepID=A0ABQ1M5H5_9SPHI|nr:sigma-70 family RNA polymerase sigma factor [Parapedobacter defluvii]GGC34705.1 DNA-directed RNA polymerase sigma-70 factor [Parapedobacter defluvii]
MTNTEWTTLLQTGDPHAYGDLYRRYWKLLYTHARSRVDDDAAAQDIVQDVFVRVWQKRQRLSLTTSMEAFLLGCVKMQVLSYYKKEKVRQRVIERAMQQLDILLEAGTDPVREAELDRSLQLALEDVPEKMRQSFLLRCDNRSIREIAELLGIAEQTVSNNLHEVVIRLRKKITQEHPGEYLTCLGLFLSLLND